MPRPEESIPHSSPLLGRAGAQFLAGDSGAALDSLEPFLAAQQRPLDGRELDTCERILDREFDRSRERVLPLYRRLVALGSRRHLTVILTLECVLNEGDLRTCAELAGLLGTADAAWEHRILGRYFVASGEPERAAPHFLSAGRKRLDYFPVVVEMLENLRKIGHHPAALALVTEARGRLAPPEMALLELRVADLQPETLPDIAAACGSAFATDAGVFFRFLRNVGERLPKDRLLPIYECLAQRFPDNVSVLAGIAALEAERQNYASAQEWIRRAIQHAGSSPEVPKLRFQQLQHLCQAGRYGDAREISGQLAHEELKPVQQLYIGRLFAELGEWDRALAIIEQALPGLDELDDSAVSLIARVGRRSAGQLGLLRSIAASLPRVSAAKKRTATALYEDWITGEAGLRHPEAAADLVRDLELPMTELMALKLAVLAPQRPSAAPVGGATATKRRAVFYCADRAYILPALVSLASLLHHNRGFDRAEFYLVASDDLAPLTRGVLQTLSQHFSVSLGVVPASELAHEASGLRPSFGAFTGGQFLSEAAYYRIYMARKLALTGNYEQLLYLDSDSVVSHGFDAILDLPVNDAALLVARIDADLPGVRTAIRRFGLQDGRYFNSGVLWFPHVSRRLVDHLEDTIRVAVERNSELMFLDQCALNVAFAETFEPLPARFNFFAGPEKIREFLETPAADACFIHMLNRIKPWDSAYPAGSPIQRRWISELRSLQRIVGDAAIRDFLTARS